MSNGRNLVRLYKNKGLSIPLFTSTSANGNRTKLTGTDGTITWETKGDLLHGSIITVSTTTPNGFGLPDDRGQSLSMIGNETTENGVINNWLAKYAENEVLRGYWNGGNGKAVAHSTLPLDPESPFYGVCATVKSNFTRHPNIPCNFRMTTFKNISDSGTEPGLFSWPNVFTVPNNPRLPYNGKLFVATWVFYDTDNASEICTMQYQNLTGTFQTGANTHPVLDGSFITGGIVEVGERCTLSSTTGKNAQGYVKLVHNGWIYVEVDNSYVPEWETTDWTNTTITGNVSGAVCTMPTLTLGVNLFQEGASKSARILQADTWANGMDVATVIAGVNCGLGINVFYGATNDAVNANPVTVTTRAWHRRTIWVDYRPDANGKIKCGQVIDHFPPQICLIDVHQSGNYAGPVMSNWGIEATVPNAHTCYVGELKSYTDNLMCIISDSPTWSGVNYLESEPLCLHGKRTSTKARFRLSRGIYSTLNGKYLYMLSDPVTPINTNGVLLTDTPT